MKIGIMVHNMTFLGSLTYRELSECPLDPTDYANLGRKESHA